MSLLGIDLGTSQAKALLVAEDGTELGRGAAGYDISTPRDGWAQTDTRQWWDAVRTAVRSAASAGAEVHAIAVTGQMHGLVLISERHVVLAPAMLWLDRRAAAEAAAYPDFPGLANAPSPGRAGPMLAWVARHQPQVYGQARWQLQPKDWLRLRLTGEVATDPTDASATLLYDLARDAWAVEVAEALGLRTDLLPPIRSCTELAGHLLPEAAAELGLEPGIPVAVGAADTAASLLAASLPAAGVRGDGSPRSGDDWAMLTLGTGGQWVIPAGPGAEPDPSGRTSLFRAVDGSAYRLAGGQNVGVTLDWVRRTLQVTWDDLYAAAACRTPGPVFLPWLVAEAGETSGGWTGVTLAHTREDLLHAALLGVAGLLRGLLDDLRAASGGPGPAKVLLGGGGSLHQGWRDLLAEVLEVPLIPGAPWLTARGAVLIAAGVSSRGLDSAPIHT
jgi:xylulokinase